MIWWLIWLITGLGQSLLLHFAAGLGYVPALADGMFSAIIYSLLAIAVWFPIIQLRSGQPRPLLTLSNHLFLFAITSLVWLFGVKWLVITVIPDPDQYSAFWNSSVFIRACAGLFFYTAIVLLYYLMISLENISRKEIKEANLQNMLRETELMMLRSQINPHFLFNSLNSISSLTVTDPPKAREMVIKLSEFMRYALSRKEDRKVPLATELENIKLYLDIEKVRFGNKVEFEEIIDEKSGDISVPNMILQPLYENAIKHGVYESIGKVLIRLEAGEYEGGVKIQITNNYDPDNVPARGTGTGIANVRRRLELYYAGQALLNTRKENGLFIAELYIPSEMNRTDKKT